MVSRRLSREAGHRRKFLVIVDDSREGDRAVVYAATRAARTDGVLVLLAIIEPGDFQHWRGVESLMRAEAMDEAESRLAVAAERARALAAVDPQLVIREGKTAEAVAALIEEDPDIAILVLGTGVGGEGPGHLVSALLGRAGVFPIPVTLVPGDIDDDTIAQVA